MKKPIQSYKHLRPKSLKPLPKIGGDRATRRNKFRVYWDEMLLTVSHGNCALHDNQQECDRYDEEQENENNLLDTQAGTRVE